MNIKLRFSFFKIGSLFSVKVRFHLISGILLSTNFIVLVVNLVEWEKQKAYLFIRIMEQLFIDIKSVILNKILNLNGMKSAWKPT